ncbi:hypothetical protein CONLIGDRAFT_481862 [Coniochaeta ligniaria NRRL 30616]|uniref:Hydrophobin n=1 Tax=Coniochaeta ligniaria NRRL 30616 TaxID=1408157 RepID=A0A1J7JG86_9PEZI|nr:hypothetical protein CONLIGDRAFT_481862 [Coniochaeta ligniaria NRRL 30616]
MFSIRTTMFSLFLLLSSLLMPVRANPTPGLFPLAGKIPILDALLALGASPPPKLLQTVNPSPECAAINQGELQCCRAMVAGDVQLVVWIAMVYGYNLNPNDINGLNCDNNLDACPGVKVCCQVTALNPLLSLWCQDAQA